MSERSNASIAKECPQLPAEKERPYLPSTRLAIQTWGWPISTLTSQIALDMSYSSGLHRSALFGMGVVLFIISATLVGIVRLISKKKRG